MRMSSVKFIETYIGVKLQKWQRELIECLENRQMPKNCAKTCLKYEQVPKK